MTSVSFNVPINDDNIFEANEEFRFTIDPNSLPTDVTRGSLKVATVTIVDNDGMYAIFTVITINPL